MKPVKNCTAKKALSEREKLPLGGYVLRILKGEEITFDWGRKLRLNFDVAEGEHNGFFQADYSAQQQEDKKWRGKYELTIPEDDLPQGEEWKLATFNNFIACIEESNPGYHWEWDETTLKDKLIGGVWREFEWAMNERDGIATECGALKSVEDIRKGRFKPLKIRKLKTATQSNKFQEIGNEDDCPF